MECKIRREGLVLGRIGEGTGMVYVWELGSCLESFKARCQSKILEWEVSADWGRSVKWSLDFYLCFHKNRP